MGGAVLADIPGGAVGVGRHRPSRKRRRRPPPSSCAVTAAAEYSRIVIPQKFLPEPDPNGQRADQSWDNTRQKTTYAGLLLAT